MDVRRLQANNYKRMDGLKVNSLGIDVGKKKCRAALKDERGDIIREFFFSNNNEGISDLIQSASHYGKCIAVLEGNTEKVICG
jgi:transposase